MLAVYCQLVVSLSGYCLVTSMLSASSLDVYVSAGHLSEDQFEEMDEIGTLNEYLAECGYDKHNGAIVPKIEMIGFEKYFNSSRCKTGNCDSRIL